MTALSFSRPLLLKSGTRTWFFPLSLSSTQLSKHSLSPPQHTSAPFTLIRTSIVCVLCVSIQLEPHSNYSKPHTITALNHGTHYSMTPAKIPLQRCSTSAAAAISSAPASQRAFSSVSSSPLGFSVRVQKAVSWLQGQGQQTQAATTTTLQLHPSQHRQRAHSLLLHNGTSHQPHHPHFSNTALFSTSGATQRLSKEEEDLYQVRPKASSSGIDDMRHMSLNTN